MILLVPLLALLAASPPSTLDQVRAEQNPDHRARAAIDYAAVAERNAESAYDKGDLKAVAAELKNMQDSFDAAQQAFEAAHKTPGRNPGQFKYAEMHSRELLNRLRDLEQKMDPTERSMLDEPRAKVQELHDVWFEGIMGKKK